MCKILCIYMVVSTLLLTIMAKNQVEGSSWVGDQPPATPEFKGPVYKHLIKRNTNHFKSLHNLEIQSIHRKYITNLY